MSVPAVLEASDTLPAMVRNAANRLAAAETSAQVLEARELAGATYDAAKRAGRLARAKSAHDEIIAKVYRAQADALEIESLAKRKLADEYDAAQERGEVRTAGKPNFSQAEKYGFTDLGLTGKEIHEARRIRDAETAEPGIVRRVLDERLASGSEPTKAALREAVIEAARQGLAPDRKDRSNPEYVNDPAYRMLLRILGPSRAMIEQVDGGEIVIATALGGFLDGSQRERALRDIARARDFLSQFMEAANAH